jgi:hypothetical protein
VQPEGSDQKGGRSSLLLHFDASSSRMAINAALQQIRKTRSKHVMSLDQVAE